MKLKVLFLATGLLFLLSAKADISFLKQPDWKDVMGKAKETHKFIFVDAYTDWCSWCKEMDKTTFTDTTVIAFMNQNFICVKMDMEKDLGADMAMKYRVNGYPTYLVFSPDGRFIERTVGYMKPFDFIKTVDKIKGTPESDYPKGVSTEMNPAFPDFYRAAFVKNKDGKRVLPDSTVVRDYFNHTKDYTSEINWSIVWRYHYMVPQLDSWILSHHSQLRSLFGNAEIESLLSAIIYTRVKKAAEKKDEAMLDKEVLPLVDSLLTKDSQSAKTGYRLDFYRFEGDYVKAMKTLGEMITMPGMGDYTGIVNEVCWDVYEKSDDPIAIQSAVKAMKLIVTQNPVYYYLDTYAALLYKQKDYSDAEKYAKIAIDTGKKADMNVEETEKLLEKIRAAKG
ncbi:MAG TPA: DUF255 domain-containing protein [Chitinophagales bacterium]|nr:DUF255 domain-containing protein [Chitinophagales bacterium]